MATKTVKIAPSREEVTLGGNVLRTSFNGMDIEYRLAGGVTGKYSADYLRDILCQAIAMSGKLWQLPFLLNNNGVPGECYVDGEYVNYPKD